SLQDVQSQYTKRNASLPQLFRYLDAMRMLTVNHSDIGTPAIFCCVQALDLICNFLRLGFTAGTDDQIDRPASQWLLPGESPFLAPRCKLAVHARIPVYHRVRCAQNASGGALIAHQSYFFCPRIVP